MLKNVLSQSWRRGAQVLQEGPAEALYACSSRFHSGQVINHILTISVCYLLIITFDPWNIYVVTVL
jgi:hypothetical protein